MIDSLIFNKQIDSLQNQIIALKDITTQNTIAKDYFSDILTSQLTIFSVIVGLIGLISFSTIYFRIQKVEKDMNLLVANNITTLESKLNQFETKITEDFKNLEIDLRSNEFDIYRAFQIICETNKEFNNAFIWSLRIIELLQFDTKHYDGIQNDILFWIDHSYSITQMLSYKKFTKNNLDEIKGIIYKFNTSCEIIEVKEGINKVEKDFFNRYYKVIGNDLN